MKSAQILAILFCFVSSGFAADNVSKLSLKAYQIIDDSECDPSKSHCAECEEKKSMLAKTEGIKNLSFSALEKDEKPFFAALTKEEAKRADCSKKFVASISQTATTCPDPRLSIEDGMDQQINKTHCGADTPKSNEARHAQEIVLTQMWNHLGDLETAGGQLKAAQSQYKRVVSNPVFDTSSNQISASNEKSLADQASASADYSKALDNIWSGHDPDMRSYIEDVSKYYHAKGVPLKTFLDKALNPCDGFSFEKRVLKRMNVLACKRANDYTSDAYKNWSDDPSHQSSGERKKKKAFLESSHGREYLSQYMKNKSPDEQKFFTCMLEGKYGKGTKDLYVTAQIGANLVVIGLTAGASTLFTAGAVAAEGVAAADAVETVETAATTGRTLVAGRIMSTMVGAAFASSAADSLFWNCGGSTASSSSQTSDSCIGDSTQAALKAGHPDQLPNIVSQFIEHKTCQQGAAMAGIAMVVPAYKFRALALTATDLQIGATVLRQVGTNYETVTVKAVLGANVMIEDGTGIAKTVPKSSLFSQSGLSIDDSAKLKNLRATAASSAGSDAAVAAGAAKPPPGVSSQLYNAIGAIQPGERVGIVMEGNANGIYGNVPYRKVMAVSGKGLNTATNVAQFENNVSINLATDGEKIQSVAPVMTNSSPVVISRGVSAGRDAAFDNLKRVPSNAEVVLSTGSNPPIRVNFLGLSPDGSKVVYSTSGKALEKPLNELSTFEYRGQLYNTSH